MVTYYQRYRSGEDTGYCTVCPVLQLEARTRSPTEETDESMIVIISHASGLGRSLLKKDAQSPTTQLEIAHMSSL